MVSDVTLKPKTRVHLRDHPIGVRLRSMRGCVERFDPDDEYYLVRLDEPATYFHADGSTEELDVIREAGDNLIVGDEECP